MVLRPVPDPRLVTRDGVALFTMSPSAWPSQLIWNVSEKIWIMISRKGGGKGSLARDVIPSRATKTRVSNSSLQLGQHQLFTGPGLGCHDDHSRLLGQP